MVPILPKAGWLEKALVLLGRRRIVSVDGDSMYPALRDGDRVVVDPRSKIHVGDMVLAEHPFKSSVRLIKRVTQITDEHRYFLAGDNPVESSDSRGFGALADDKILGRVTSRV